MACLAKGIAVGISTSSGTTSINFFGSKCREFQMLALISYNELLNLFLTDSHASVIAFAVLDCNLNTASWR